MWRPLDIMTFSAWVEPGGVERGLAAVLEEMQRIRQHGFTDTELAREKSNLLRSVESLYKQRDQTSSADLVDEYVDHFLSETPVPGIEARVGVVPAAASANRPGGVRRPGSVLGPTRGYGAFGRASRSD